jgi:hypothetical protein
VLDRCVTYDIVSNLFNINIPPIYLNLIHYTLPLLHEKIEKKNKTHFFFQFSLEVNVAKLETTVYQTFYRI